MELYIYIYIYVMAFALSFALVPLCKKIAFRFNILDHPGHRKVHSNSKPLLGGVAVFVAFNATIILNILGFYYLKNTNLLQKFMSGSTINIFNRLPDSQERIIYFLAGGLIIFIVGLLDDSIGQNFPVKVKTLGQILAAVVLLFSGAKIDFMHNAFLSYAISLIWIVGISNSFNLLDNMDGLSSGVAIIASFIFMLLAISQGQMFTVMVLCAFIGALMGFYPFNVYPSTIFLGDAGSLFIGYVAASLTIFQSYATGGSSPILAVLTPVLILSVPLFDTFSVIIIRLKERRPIYVGDKKHLSHRLVELGMTQRQAVWFIYLTTVALGVGALLLPDLKSWGGIVIILQSITIISLISLLMFFGIRKRLNK